MSVINDFYTSRNVLVTGATGFLGKVLIEKLLRSCPKIGKIYIIIRPKRGIDVCTRLQNLLKSELFSGLRKSSPESLDKVIAVQGDLAQPLLGIDQAEIEEIVNDVSVVFHSAATVKFDEPLKSSVQMNIVGTAGVIQLCRKISNLDALIHVSSAYSNCDKSRVEEKIYPCSVGAQQLISAIEWMNDDMIDKITPALLNGKPNTYTFTKALAEQLLHDQGSDLPIAIIRPSIIGSAWNEPLTGWVDNYNGPTGTFLAYSTGVMRHLLLDVNSVADIIPVDIPVNMMIAAAWHTASTRSCNLVIYNCTSSQENPVKWGTIVKYIEPMALSTPVQKVFRAPSITYSTNKLFYSIGVLLEHHLPAFIIDSISQIFTKNSSTKKLYSKLHKGLDSLEFFRMNEWEFISRNCHHLWQSMSSEDQKVFNFKITKLNWKEYFENYYIGMKRYLLNESIDNLDKAKYLLKRKQMESKCLNLLSVLLFITFILKRLQFSHSIRYLLIQIASKIYSAISHLCISFFF